MGSKHITLNVSRDVLAWYMRTKNITNVEMSVTFRVELP